MSANDDTAASQHAFKVVSTSDELVEEITHQEHENTILVVGWTQDNCQCCQRASQYLQHLPGAHPELHFIQADVTRCATAARKYQVKALPTVMVFREGKKVDQLLGVCEQATRELLTRCTCKESAAPSAN